jgi:hypothetical protein
MFTKYTVEITTGDDGEEMCLRTSVHGFAVYGTVTPTKDSDGEVINGIYDAKLEDHVTGKTTELATVVDFETATRKVHEAMIAFVRNPGGAPEAADALESALI